MADISGASSEAVDSAFASSVIAPPRSYGYARSHRIVELVGLCFGSTLLVVTAVRAISGLTGGVSCLALASLIFGLCLADLFSGVVHWAADSYGSSRMPVFGGFVRTFREHHTDQQEITRHDAVETNGDVFIFSSPVHFVLLLLVSNPLWLSLIFGVFVGSYANSQIHKWAHVAQPPSFVRALQRSRFVLSPEHHAKHHAGRHESNYCITSGWMNWLLDTSGFFRAAEWFLAKVGIEGTNSTR